MRARRKALAALAFAALCAARPWAQAAAAAASAGTAGQPSAAPVSDAPKPENPWSRFEIVSFGSLPIALFYADFMFDLARFAQNGWDVAYAPWPLKSTGSATLTDSERITRIGAAVGLSLAVGAVDWFIRDRNARAAKRLRESRLRALPADPAPEGKPETAPGVDRPNLTGDGTR
jgi:hypothetical protein